MHEWLKDHNATQAAIRAGYSKNGATVQGARLLANAKVLEYKEKLLANIQKPTIATIEEIL